MTDSFFETRLHSQKFAQQQPNNATLCANLVFRNKGVDAGSPVDIYPQQKEQLMMSIALRKSRSSQLV
ncbi:MAG: hypothetical protein U5N10_08050 [Gemmobacter sp.]|nr:hypothetical protein [Gemmobacter sp.]